MHHSTQFFTHLNLVIDDFNLLLFGEDFSHKVKASIFGEQKLFICAISTRQEPNLIEIRQFLEVPDKLNMRFMGRIKRASIKSNVFNKFGH